MTLCYGLIIQVSENQNNEGEKKGHYHLNLKSCRAIAFEHQHFAQLIQLLCASVAITLILAHSPLLFLH